MHLYIKFKSFHTGIYGNDIQWRHEKEIFGGRILWSITNNSQATLLHLEKLIYPKYHKEYTNLSIVNIPSQFKYIYTNYSQTLWKKKKMISLGG